MTQNNLATVLGDLGTRTAGQKGNDLLNQAVDAFKAALLVFTREQLPQDWAATQNNLGNVLKDLGTRTAGQKGNDLLNQAVDAFRAALLVRTREQLPQDWAATQNNLGNVLKDLGTRTAGQKGNDLLNQAVDAFKAALLVRTREQLPVQWAQSNAGLARAALRVGAYLEAVRSARDVLVYYPDDDEMVSIAGGVSHDRLFAFDDAYTVYAAWVTRHPDDRAGRANLTEACLTNGRGTEAQGQLAILLGGPSAPASELLPLHALDAIASLLAG
jgi:tetratricopeptide (TPR) repeat protein